MGWARGHREECGCTSVAAFAGILTSVSKGSSSAVLYKECYHGVSCGADVTAEVTLWNLSFFFSSFDSYRILVHLGQNPLVLKRCYTKV